MTTRSSVSVSMLRFLVRRDGSNPDIFGKIWLSPCKFKAPQGSAFAPFPKQKVNAFDSQMKAMP